MREMGPPFSRRVLKRAVAPAKITIVDGVKGGREYDALANKENMLNSSLYTLFEDHYQKTKDSSSAAGQSQASRAIELKGTATTTVLQPRKRPLGNRRSDRSAAAAVPEHDSRELSPPELTTSDTFEPAKRTLPPAGGVLESDGTHSPHMKIKTPVLETSDSCDVLVASPRELKKAPATPELEQQHQRFRGSSGARRDSLRKAPSSGRRLSILRLSIAREGGAVLSNSRVDTSSSVIKKHSPAKLELTNSTRSPNLNGKGMVFSAIKRTVSAEASSSVGCHTEIAKARVRAAERRKSIGEGFGSCGGRAGISKKNAVEKAAGSGNTSLPQTDSVAAKATAESIRTRKLSMVLKSEQRLAERNEQYGAKLRELHAQIEEKDHEAERLRTAALMLNNMINRQAEENRDLKLRLKDAFNDNAELHSVCEKMERELRKTREMLKLERLQVVATKRCETKNLTDLTSRVDGLTNPSRQMEVAPPAVDAAPDAGEKRVDKEGPSLSEGTAQSEGLTHIDDQSLREAGHVEQYTLQDLQDMVSQEEDLLKERCANLLEELNLPCNTLLSTRGSLNVISLKKTLAEMSLTDENLTAERKSSIRKLSAWIGSG